MLQNIVHKQNLLLICIFLIAVFFRFYHLGNIPAGLINDEADTGYDAYSVLLTGHDQWNTFLPLTSFKGFGDYRPVLYTYLVVPAIKLFGLNTFAVRFPSAFFGSLSVLVIFFLGKKLFSKEVGIFGGLLFAISPWAIGMSRVGIESNVAIFFTLLGILLCISSRNKPLVLLGGFLSLILAIYTYAAYTLFIPLVFFALLFFWRKIMPLTKKTITYTSVILILSLLPFLIVHGTAHTRLSQIGFFNSLDNIGLTTVLNDQVGSCWQAFPPSVCKLALNKPILYISVYVKNYLSHFSPEFLYLSGSATQFAILPVRGFEYIIEALFALVGVYGLIKSKKKEGIFLVVLFLLAPIPDAITGIGHYSRATVMLPFLLLIEAFGIAYFLSLLKNTGMLYKIASLGIIIIFLYSAGSFWIVYATYFKEQYALYSQYGYQELIQNIDREKPYYDAIYLSRHLNDTKQYIYYLFYNAYNPKKFQQKQDVLSSQGVDGWVSIDKIDAIFFIPTIPTKAQTLQEKKHVLLISNPVDFPKQISSVFAVRDLQNNIIFEAVDSSILQQYYKTHETTQAL